MVEGFLLMGGTAYQTFRDADHTKKYRYINEYTRLPLLNEGFLQIAGLQNAGLLLWKLLAYNLRVQKIALLCVHILLLINQSCTAQSVTLSILHSHLTKMFASMQVLAN